MKLRLDKETDALYLRLDESIIQESEEVQPGIILDYNAAGTVPGIEILNLSERIKPDQIKIFQYQNS
jgi:uncharacterized protein YuzE